MAYDKQRLLEALWNNPNAATHMDFIDVRGVWQSRKRPDGTDSSRKDKSTLKRGRDGQIFFNYNGGSFPSGDVFNLLQIIYGTNDMAEVFERAAEAYGIQPDINPQQQQEWRQRMARADMATKAAAVVTSALQTPEAADVVAYLQGRGLTASPRLGYFSKAMKDSIAETLKASLQDINALFPTTRKDYTNSKEGTWTDFADSYGLILPYYNGSRVNGFCLRLTSGNAPTYKDSEGNVQTMPKYLFTRDMPKGGYCMPLKPTAPVIMVEGLLDAEAVMQSGRGNVIALGGMTPTDNEDAAKSSIKTLQRYGIRHIVYMPDIEYNEDGTLKTDATERTIKAIQPLLTGCIDGVGFISLHIAAGHKELQDVKDAADIMQKYGAEGVLQVLDNPVTWWAWATQQNITRNADNPADMAADFMQMYLNIQSPIERQLIKTDLTAAAPESPLQLLKAAGITADSLTMADRTGRATLYRDTMTEAIDALKDAADKHATAATIGNLLDNAMKAQRHSAFTDFKAKVNATPEQIRLQLMQEPDAVTTTWQMYRDNNSTLNNGKPFEARKISFSPSAVSVFAAPTSHGKTLVMLQTALNIAQQRQHVLYVGLENDEKQLFVRALCAYIGDALQGMDVKPRRALRQFLKQQGYGINDLQKTAAIDEILQEKYNAFCRDVFPYLHMVRMDSDCDTICDNIAAQVEAWQNIGQPTAAIFIDYIQLLHVAGRNFSRTDELKNICDSINELSKKTGLPVIVGSQMNRTATKGEGNIPPFDNVDLYNIGESSGIENIAEDCYFIWNTDRTNTNRYIDKKSGFVVEVPFTRSKRIFTDNGKTCNLRRQYIYIENLKSRDEETGCYCLIKTNFATGSMATETEY